MCWIYNKHNIKNKKKVFIQQEILDVIYWNGIRKYIHTHPHIYMQIFNLSLFVIFLQKTRISRVYKTFHKVIYFILVCLCKHIWRRSWSLECVLMCHDCGLSPSSHHHHPQHDSFVKQFFKQPKTQASKI